MQDESPKDRSISETIYTWDDLPFRGSPEPVTERDPKTIPKIGKKAHAKTFLTNNEDDMKEYVDILQGYAESRVIYQEEKEYDQGLKAWRIFVTWWDIFYHQDGKSEEF